MKKRVDKMSLIKKNSYARYDPYILFAFSLTIILWASAFPMIKIALADFKAENLSAIRLFIASIVLIVLAVIKKYPLPEKNDIPLIMLLGFSGFTIYHVALSFGEYYISAGVASLLVSTTPIFSAILAKYFLKERFTKKSWYGSCIAFLGVGLLSLSSGNNKVMGFGVILVLIASLGESIYFVFQNKFLNKYGFIPFTIYTIISGTIFTIIFLPDAINELQSASNISVLAVIYLGIFPSVIPYIALAYTIQKIGTSEATMSLYLTPVISLILSYLILQEIPSQLAIIGGIITIIGVTLISVKERN